MGRGCYNLQPTINLINSSAEGIIIEFFKNSAAICFSVKIRNTQLKVSKSQKQFFLKLHCPKILGQWSFKKKHAFEIYWPLDLIKDSLAEKLISKVFRNSAAIFFSVKILTGEILYQLRSEFHSQSRRLHLLQWFEDPIRWISYKNEPAFEILQQILH